jgi:hypothetical protein
MPLTEELTFQLGDSGTILNTDSVSLPFVDITDVVGLDNAPYRETERDHEGTDGGFLDAEFEKGRPIVLVGEVFTESGSMEAYLDQLKADFAPSRTLVPFYYKAPGVDERVLFVKPQGVAYDWETLRRTGRAKIKFKCFAEDPRIYNASLSEYTVDYSAGALVGFGFPLGFDFGFGGSTSTDTVTVTNTGNRPTPPTFIITGPVNTPIIRDETYNHVLQFDLTLAAGETLTVNNQYKTVTLNDGTNLRSALQEPDWFFLEQGDTSIRYTAYDGTGSSMTVQFRSAYR